MKTQLSKIYALALATLISSSGFAAGKTAEDPKTAKKFIKEGIWRGVFKISETEVPFNFELKGKDAEHATFTLLNGTRRDDFHVQYLGKDSLFIKMTSILIWLSQY